MSSFNKIFLIGRLARDPELQQTSTGGPLVDFTLIVKRSYSLSSGEQREESSHFEVLAWSEQAELSHKHLAKGKLVFVEGRLYQERWKTKEGNPRSKIKIAALDIQFLE